MDGIQPQLLNIPLNPTDIVYTPDWVAKDMVEFFNPTGRILEPAKGDGAFLKHLPGADWCEIQEGRDFFQWKQKYDWIIGNPPYSAALFNNWLSHSFDLALNIVYLLPIHFVFRSASKLQICENRGWMKQVRFYGTGSALNFTMGNPIAAMYFQRDYHGPTSWSWYHKENTNA